MADVSLFPGDDNLKYCWDCKLTKPLSSFNKHTYSKDGRQNRCRACGNAACRAYYNSNIEAQRERARKRPPEPIEKRRVWNKQWAEANPDRARYHSRKKLLGSKYNMTIEEHDALFEAQGFKCGACGSSDPNSKKGWSTDHCHKTGIVRGIVCHHCNIGIGHAKDNIETIRSWIAYLERSSGS
jgi:hypothetical protein